MDLHIVTHAPGGDGALVTLAAGSWDEGSQPLPKVEDAWVHNGAACIISYVRTRWTFESGTVRGVATMLILSEDELISRTSDRWWEATP